MLPIVMDNLPKLFHRFTMRSLSWTDFHSLYLMTEVPIEEGSALLFVLLLRAELQYFLLVILGKLNPSYFFEIEKGLVIRVIHFHGKESCRSLF